MGLLCVDTFSKYLTLVPIESNKPIPLGNGLLKTCQLQGKAPDILFSDSEGSLFNKDLIELLGESSAQIVTTTTHARLLPNGQFALSNHVF